MSLTDEQLNAMNFDPSQLVDGEQKSLMSTQSDAQSTGSSATSTTPLLSSGQQTHNQYSTMNNTSTQSTSNLFENSKQALEVR